MSQFDAKASRRGRPLPLWVDAFQRKTMLLEADEVGAYINILMAMWMSRDVALPNEPKKLARAARVSVRLWNTRIWPALEDFFSECEDGLTQERLREEAAYVERQVTLQHSRKVGEKSSKSRKTNDPPETVDISMDTTPDEPTYNLPSDTNVSGDKPPDLKKIAFDRGRALLVAAGKSDGAARTVIGGWRKSYSDEVIIAAIASCEKAGAVEPVAYCEAILKKSKPPTGAVPSGAFGLIPERTE